MIAQVQLIRNIGQFQSVTPGAAVPFSKLHLVFAENGRGKTTLTAILRSLKSGDPNPILERRRLGSQHPPHVVVVMTQPDQQHQFSAGTWDTNRPDIQIFDDSFVRANVHQGQSVEAEQRRNLLELVLGEQGVQLSRRVNQLATEGRAYTNRVKDLEKLFSPETLNGFSVEAFCDLRPEGNLDETEAGLKRRLAAAEQVAVIEAIPNLWAPDTLPPLDATSINKILARVIPGLSDQLVAEVRAHFTSLAEEGESWVNRGMAHEAKANEGRTNHSCPMCAQDLAGSAFFKVLQRYFGPEYQELTEAIGRMQMVMITEHDINAHLQFERAVNLVIATRAKWLPYVALPEMPFDPLAVPAWWRNVASLVSAALQLKAHSPLERQSLPQNALDALKNYEIARRYAADIAQAVATANTQIAAARTQAAHEDLGQLRIGLSRVAAMRARQIPAVAQRCQEYRTTQEAQRSTEVLRTAARAELETYTQAVFGQYQTAINGYLERFAAGFKIGAVRQEGVPGGSVCNYQIEILGQAVSVAGGNAPAGQPSFANTLSAGDRNALALAFFMANLDTHPRLGEQVVVIDDPMSSLDDQRKLQTVLMIQALAGRAKQVVVLSHSPGFLVQMTDKLPGTISTSVMKITRKGQESAFERWDLEALKRTEHDRRHDLLAAFGQAGGPDAKAAAVEIRPHLEHYLRVARPGLFPQTNTLGQMAETCRDRLAQGSPIFNAQETQTLRDLNVYSSQFHHDTNPAWATVHINEAELAGFISSTLSFTGR